MLTNMLIFLVNNTGTIFFGVVLGAVLSLFLRNSSDKSPAAKLGRAKALLVVCIGLLVVYGAVQFLLSKIFEQLNISGLFILIYAMIVTVMIPFIISAGYVRFVAPLLHALRDAAKRRAPTPRVRLMIVLGGCMLAAIAYFLPWSQAHDFGHSSPLVVYHGKDLDANPPYYITLFNLGKYPYAFLFTLVAIPLTSVFAYLMGHDRLVVQVFGRSLHALQVFFLLISVYFVTILSVGEKDATLLGGFWLVLAGLVIVFIGLNWPYRDTKEPSKQAVFVLSAAFLVLTFLVIHFGGINIAISLAKALGGSGVAIFFAAFLYDLLGPGLFSAGYAVLRAGIAAYRSEKE